MILFCGLLLLSPIVQTVVAQTPGGGGLDDLSGTISGKYVDSEAGFEIDLPEGWKGIKLGPLGAIVSPYGTPFSGDNSKASMIINIVSVAMLVEGVRTFAGTEPSLDTPTNVTSNESAFRCNDEKSYLYLNGMITMHAVSECKAADESQFTKSNIYNVATKKNLISVGLSSNSAESYEQFVDAFEASIQTLVVKNATDHRAMWNEALGLRSEIHGVRANGNDVNITIQSNSGISNFALDETQKRISFTVDGQNGTNGFTIIPISRVLQGPYSVTLDGEVKNDYTIADDKIAGALLMEIGYRHSSHDIVITGTNVVPEFPFSAVGIIMIFVLGIVATLGRVRLF